MSRRNFHAGRARWALVASLAVIAAACNKDTPTGAAGAASFSIAGPYTRAGIVGQQLQGPLVVQMNDANGNPAAGQAVSFTVRGNGGSVIATAKTDANGRAWALFKLGALAGLDTVVATAGDQSVTFVVQAMPGTLAQFQMVSGDQQAVVAGADAAFVVRALDAYGNSIPGVLLNWLDLSGGLIVAAGEVTDASGLAQARLQTNADPGLQYLVQVLSGDGSVSITFTVNAN